VPYPCSDKEFCAKHWSYEKEHLRSAKSENVSYRLEPNSVEIDSERLTGTIYRLENPEDIELASEVTLTMDLYQNGILRVLIEEPNSDRFRISKQGISVMDDQLVGFDQLSAYTKHTEDYLLIDNIPSDDFKESYSFKINYEPF